VLATDWVQVADDGWKWLAAPWEDSNCLNFLKLENPYFVVVKEKGENTVVQH